MRERRAQSLSRETPSPRVRYVRNASSSQVLADAFERFALVDPIRTHGDMRAKSGGHEQNAQDATAISGHVFALFAAKKLNIGLIAAGKLHQARCGSSMQS